MKKVLLIAVAVLISSCKEKPLEAQGIIDKAISVAGGSAYEQFEMEFDFRGRHYISKRDFGNFEYKRITTDSLGETTDTYSNSKAFSRTVNGMAVRVTDTLGPRIENSINSVNYFLLLPYGLNDAAVNKTLIGKTTIKEVPYYKIEVTFSEEGGGSDFEDVFVYWIHAEEFTVDYFAYRYFTDGGGWRFREAFNPRIIGGMRFVDYRNFKPNETPAELRELDRAFENGELELLSVIETENIVVR